MAENRIRWRILDELLGAGKPVSTEDIFKEWDKHGIPVRFGTEDKTLQEKYEITLRQDLFKFRKIYKEAGLEKPLLLESNSNKDKRKRTYQYAEPDFSIMPFLGEKYTKANWKEIDDALTRLFQLIPQELAEQIDFYVNGRIDAYKETGTFVDWSDNPQLLGYDMLPKLYKYVKRKQPVQISFAMFNSPAERFILHPYLLKEYNGRWYCFGFREDKQLLWPVSVDRIKAGSIREADVPFKAFSHLSDSTPWDYFSNIIGVTKEYNEVSARDFYVSDKEYEIILKVTSYREWKYLVTNPIHRSQRVLTEYNTDKQEGKISISVICNIEMYNTILSRGRNVQIESPAFARDIISSMVKDIDLLYQ